MSQLVFDRILGAIGADDRAQLLQQATEDMRQAVTPQVWDEIRQVAPHVKAGYKPTHMRRWEEQGCEVDVRKLSFDDGSQDVMLRVVRRGGELAGLWRDVDAF